MLNNQEEAFIMNKETLIDLIDMMIGLTEIERKRLSEMEMRKVEIRYKMALSEKTDEMIG
ncbi:hypothetical protein G6X62_12655 [Staphylococcus aureus]|uniref:hypothetical protein n=1 Tax=Staphylococcus aureus TaxID=1280 RepID=UPI00045AAAE5|nr:hypothetical protein [Staphylococcus aureus]KAJ45845.1 hypothetical protein HMPREF1625_04349 [Staphylococcus aureus 880]NGV34068.1 hypothetical protein [Staphylococcus aureus]